ncbi:MAG TPA: LysM peptidoglycan-binding domain-containing protein [Candidatus Saccharimonadales bacterium]
MEMHIRTNQTMSLAHTQMTDADARLSMKKSAKKPLLKRIKPAAAVTYVAITALIISILSIGYRSNQQDTALFGVSGVQASETTSTSVDQVSAAKIAASLAEATDIGVQTNVANLSTSLSIQNELAQSNGTSASKPQLAMGSVKQKITQYQTKTGDSVPSIAAAHGVSADTVKWANSLTSDNVPANQQLQIPAVDGVIYTVRAGDTADGIAAKYKADKNRLITYNDAEVSGLQPNQQIVIPGGALPENERPSARASSSLSSSANVFVANFTPLYGGAGYPFGWCTHYAARMSGAPSNWGNANTWDTGARATPGWTVSSVPRAGAIAQTDAGGYGHVAIVDAVEGNMIRYSDMNGLRGFGAVGASDWVPASYFQNYIFRK